MRSEATVTHAYVRAQSRTRACPRACERYTKPNHNKNDDRQKQAENGHYLFWFECKSSATPKRGRHARQGM